MRLSVVRLGVLLVPTCLLAAGSASAQVPPAAARAAQSAPLRSQISIMEGILERAVGVGITSTINQMPDLFQGTVWVTPPRARGFRIEGYGVFFDVEVPGLPPAIWSINVLMRNNEVAFVNELNQLRAMVAQSVPEGPKRVEVTKRLDSLEARVTGAPLSESAPGAAPPPAGTASRVNDRMTLPPDRSAANLASASRPLPSRDPDAVFTSEVQKALTNVILEQAITVQLAPEEWFTIAASEPRGGGLGEPQSLSLYLSIKGKDLSALRARQITEDEAARRIIAKYY